MKITGSKVKLIGELKYVNIRRVRRHFGEGKTKMCALGAAMRKLVHICYGVVKNQRPYEALASATD